MFSTVKIIGLFAILIPQYSSGEQYIHTVIQESHVVTPCDTAEDCPGKQYSCVDSVCTCPPNTLLLLCDDSSGDDGNRDIGGKWSVVVTKLGELCTRDSDCNIQGAQCSSSSSSETPATTTSCQCRQGLVASVTKKLCLQVVENLSENCQEDVQCQATIRDSVCTKGVCCCKAAMHSNNNNCYPHIELGGRCESDIDCSVSTRYAECLANVCTCSGRYTSPVEGDGDGGGECLLSARSLLSPCRHTSQCVVTLGDGARCDDVASEGASSGGRLCHCLPSHRYQPTRNKCVLRREAADNLLLLLGVTCHSDKDCHVAGGNGGLLECRSSSTGGGAASCQCSRTTGREIDGYCEELQTQSATRSSYLISAVFNTILPLIFVYIF